MRWLYLRVPQWADRIFTTVIQPPLILFVAVPTSYFLFHGAQFTGIKDTLINYRLSADRAVPVDVLHVGRRSADRMARWYYGMSSRRGAARSTAKETTSNSLVSSVTSKVSSLLTGEQPAEDDVDTGEPGRKHTIDRPSRPAKSAKSAAARSGRTTKRTAPSRSRHARPPDTEIIKTRRRASPSPARPTERAVADAAR